MHTRCFLQILIIIHINEDLSYFTRVGIFTSGLRMTNVGRWRLTLTGLRIEHLCDIIPKAQSWLVLNLPVSHGCLHSFQCAPDQNNRFGKKCIRWKTLLLIWNRHLCLRFRYYQLGLCSVSYIANEYSIHHFCIMIKDFSISFSSVVIVQDFEAVIFYVLFGYKSTCSVIFCWIKTLRISSQFNNLFIL